MKYIIRRFSYPEVLSNGVTCIDTTVDSGLGKIEDLSTKIIEDPHLRDLRPVKRHGRFIKNITTLLRGGRKKLKEQRKRYSISTSQQSTKAVDPTVSLNTAEANKFGIAMNRLTSTLGHGSSQSLVD